MCPLFSCKPVRTLLLFGCGLIPPHGLVQEDTTDVIELNHYYDEKGELRFSQIIFWDWWDCDSAFRVATWRMYKSETMFPYRHRHGGFVSRWWDGSKLREVRAPHRRITWSQHDPEIEDRRFLPQEKRRGLSNGR